MSGGPAEQVALVRSGRAALCLLGAPEDTWGARAVIEVTGSDAPRWLDGMISNDVTELSAGGERSGCYATLLTPKGRIIADLHVLARDDGYWLEIARSRAADLIAALDRYIIADDVKLADRTADFLRVGVEGAGTETLLEAASGKPLAALAADSWTDLEIGGVSVIAARYGWSGEDALQLFGAASEGLALVEALRASAPAGQLVDCSMEALEILRIEAGTPLLGPDLDETVFPDEARLDRAISRTKGCYTGQEIVARVHSRGAVNHLLVGLRFASDLPPAVDTELVADERKTGEITSACVSPSAGAIGLGYVRREHAEPGTMLVAAGVRAEVAELPLVPPATHGTSSGG